MMFYELCGSTKFFFKFLASQVLILKKFDVLANCLHVTIATMHRRAVPYMQVHGGFYTQKK